jgi:hypothetical protein
MLNDYETESKKIFDRMYSADRICIVEENKGPIRLMLHATNSLQVDTAISIVPAEDNNTVLESLKLDTRYLSEVFLSTSPPVLHNRHAVVKFTAWSASPDYNSGKISLYIDQNDKRCTISKPAEWLRIVPKYGMGQAFEWVTVIHFFCTPGKL